MGMLCGDRIFVYVHMYYECIDEFVLIINEINTHVTDFNTGLVALFNSSEPNTLCAIFVVFFYSVIQL